MIESRRSFDYEVFFRGIQKYINAFVFFLPLGVAKIFGVSVTFYIFLIIIVKFLKRKRKLFRLKRMHDYILVMFAFILIISIFFSEETYRHIPIEKDAITIVKIIYWLLVALFFKTWASYIDFYQVSRSIFFGTVVTIAFYFSINRTLELMTQNSFAYVLVVSIPISMYYIFKKYNFITVISISVLFLYFAIASTSRAGAIIVFIELVILLVLAKYIRKRFMPLLLLASFAISIFFFPNVDMYRYELSNFIEPYSPDLSALIRKGDEGLSIDKSWLDRRQMVVKGKIIFSEHPFLGIGFSHFKYYWVDMDLISIYLNKSLEFYNRLSSHNTYIQFLAGAGIFSLLLIVYLELIILKKGLRIIMDFKFNPGTFIFVSFLGMIIYFYVIAAGMGAITWFMFGYGLSLLSVDYAGKER